MSDPISFYFDYSSSYSYLANSRIDEISAATGHMVERRPIVLGAIFHQLEHSVPSPNTSKMNYFDHDLKRCAKHMGLEFGLPTPFPFNAMQAMRVYYFFELTGNRVAKEFSDRVFHATYAEQIDVSDPANLARIVQDLGDSLDNILQHDNFEQAKSTLKTHTNIALELGVFGAPSFVYRKELFWGSDRIDYLIETVLQKD